MRISDWSSDVCSSDLPRGSGQRGSGTRLIAGLLHRGAPLRKPRPLCGQGLDRTHEDRHSAPPHERDGDLMRNFDMAAAWNDSLQLMRAYSALTVTIAAVFFFLPALAFAWFGPPPIAPPPCATVDHIRLPLPPTTAPSGPPRAW